MIKTIHINLSKHSTIKKLSKLHESINYVDAVAHKYLEQRKTELEAKQYADPNTTYRKFREEFPNLNSAVLQSTFRDVDAMIKSHIAICKKKHRLVKFAEKINMPLNLRSVTLSKSKKASRFEYWISICKVKYPIKTNEYTKKILDKTTKYAGSKIVKNERDDLILHLACEIPDPPKSTEKKYLAIDIGIVAPVVCSDNKRFGSGRYIKHRKLEFGKQRAKHQSRKQQISKKQSNWTKDLNHKISKQCVDHAVSQGITVLGIEKLRGQELSGRKFRKFNWAFKQQLNFIKYKAEAVGISVVEVNPKYTSQTCAHCGSQSKDNRQTQSRFVCIACGHRANADLNAARNILQCSLENGLTMTEPAVSRAIA